MMRLNKGTPLLAGGFWLSLTYCVIAAPSQPATQQVDESRLPVAAVVFATKRDLTRTVRLTAELKAYQEVSVFSKIPGYLRSISVDYGDAVKSGQVLAVLEVPEQEQDLAKAEAAFNLAKLDYDRIKSVSLSHPDLLAPSEVDKSKAQFEAMRAERDRTRAMTNYARIMAPFAGIISGRYADPGALVQPGTGGHGQALPIVRVSDTYRLRLVVEVPESLVPKITPGLVAKLVLPTTNVTKNVTLARTSNRVNDTTRTMHVEFDIDNKDLNLVPGTYCQLDLPVEAVGDAISLPVQAVDRGKAPNIWVVNSQGVIESRSVALGLETPEWVQINSGLQPGEAALFGNRSAFALGMKVNPHTEAPKPASEGG